MSEVIALQRWMPDIAEGEVFLCGPSTWTDGMGTSTSRGGRSE
jgi:hypothetical protein